MTIDEGNKVLWKQAITEKKCLIKNVKSGNKDYHKDYIQIKKKIDQENQQFDK